MQAIARAKNMKSIESHVIQKRKLYTILTGYYPLVSIARPISLLILWHWWIMCLLYDAQSTRRMQLSSCCTRQKLKSHSKLQLFVALKSLHTILMIMELKSCSIIICNVQICTLYDFRWCLTFSELCQGLITATKSKEIRSSILK